MTRDYSSHPKLRAIETALNKTTETLVSELGRPTSHAPDWNEFEWQIAEAVCAMQGISALLATQLRWRGPLRWESFLAEQKRQTRLRQLHIEQLLENIDMRMGAAAIACVGLKGSALVRAGLYPGGERTLGDVDVLVNPQDCQGASQVLIGMGYRESLRTWRHRVFEPDMPKRANQFGEHAGNPVKIELHEHIAERLPLREIDITRILRPEAPRAGINPYPCTAALMAHLLLHASGNMRARALRFSQLHDIALLAKSMSAQQWQSLEESNPAPQGLWWGFAPLALTARYYDVAIPADLFERIRRSCPPALRWVAQRHRASDVSWSKIRIQAFPGIEWASSIPEAVRFMASRIVPGRAALNELHDALESLPALKAVPWYGQSHLTRIARWVFSRPPRVQTIYPVRQALGIYPTSSA